MLQADEAAELASGVHVDGTPSACGWDRACELNTTLNASGERAEYGREGFGQPDRTWSDSAARAPDDPEVLQLRETLREHNGITQLEICEPHVLAELLTADGAPPHHKYCTESGRLAGRYSYGTCSASRQMLHDPAWTQMIDLPTTTPILKKLFGTPDYAVGGAGGDLSLPGSVEYQHLHRDGPTIAHGSSPPSVGQTKKAETMGLVPEGTAEKLERGQMDAVTSRRIAEMVHGGCGLNFIISDLTWENGPIRCGSSVFFAPLYTKTGLGQTWEKFLGKRPVVCRQIRGTHLNVQEPPPVEREPEWMKMSTLVGAPAGSAVFRNSSCWHGATPNISNQCRILPSIELGAGPGTPRTMPHEVWKELSPHAQHVCRYVVAEPGVWPPGAGVMHPLADRRFEAFVRLLLLPCPCHPAFQAAASCVCVCGGGGGSATGVCWRCGRSGWGAGGTVISR
jgi:hypothetical protein